MKWLLRIVLLACLAGPLGSCSPAPPRPSDAHDVTNNVRGLADIHSHQFAQFWFGGDMFTHGVNPGEPCRRPLNFDANFRLRNMVAEGLAGEAERQRGDGRCNPTVTNLSGQQMDVDSLHRAWSYGLRLLSVLAVNSEILCAFVELPRETLIGSCRDQKSIEMQLAAAKALEAQIDRDAGGFGRGWYRIVLTPQEARSVIAQGKLAVVLGVEAANAFGCWYRSRGSVPGVEGRITETAYELACEDEVTLGATHARALALFEHYWNLGARHFFPVHNMNGLAGGTSLSVPVLHAFNNPSRLTAGEPFNNDINRLITEVRPVFDSWNCSSGYEFDGGRCNTDGLSDSGRSLLKLMADYGALIDVDHMSHRMKGTAMSDELGLGPYPLVSSHSGVSEINHGDKRNESQVAPIHMDRLIRLGGAFGPILNQSSSPAETETYPPDAAVVPHRCGGTSESFVQAYRYIVQKLRGGRLYTGEPAFVGVAYGSDFNGLAGWPGPRFHDGVFIGVFDIGATLRERHAPSLLSQAQG